MFIRDTLSAPDAARNQPGIEPRGAAQIAQAPSPWPLLVVPMPRLFDELNTSSPRVRAEHSWGDEGDEALEHEGGAFERCLAGRVDAQLGIRGTS